MNNLLQSVNHLFNGEIVNKMAAAFGESEGGIMKAISGAVPAVLAGFVSKANEPNGANHLLNLSQDASNAGVISNIGSMFSGEGNILDKGLDMIRQLFGDRLEGIVQAVSNFSGIRSSSASSLISMAAPMALGVLGNEAKRFNLSAAGLAGYLNDQKANIMNALPAGLGIGSLLGTGGLGAKADAKYEQIKVNYQTADKEERKGTNWLLPLILILFAIAAILYFMKGCRNTPAVTGEEVRDTVVTMVDKVKEKMREMVQLDVNNNLKIDAYKGGIEDQLIMYLRDKDAPIEKDRWFDFDDLNFEVGSATLTSSSMRQVKNIANILNAFPNAKIKIGGYTDKTGDDAVNKRLSQERADAVHKALLAEGVKKEQLVGAEGYGSEFAKAAATDPEAVREKDRRISINVREK
jgi:outer membrane protein OmpA-like peptidoglycan-associated protein